MTLLNNLLDNSYQDTEFLLKNSEQGDQLDISRDISFILYGSDEEKVKSFCEFVNDNQYGNAKYQSEEKQMRVIVNILMPSTQHLICSISGLMTCLAELFGLEYDGWDSNIQT